MLQILVVKGECVVVQSKHDSLLLAWFKTDRSELLQFALAWQNARNFVPHIQLHDLPSCDAPSILHGNADLHRFTNRVFRLVRLRLAVLKRRVAQSEAEWEQRLGRNVGIGTVDERALLAIGDRNLPGIVRNVLAEFSRRVHIAAKHLGYGLSAHRTRIPCENHGVRKPNDFVHDEGTPCEHHRDDLLAGALEGIEVLKLLGWQFHTGPSPAFTCVVGRLANCKNHGICARHAAQPAARDIEHVDWLVVEVRAPVLLHRGLDGVDLRVRSKVDISSNAIHHVPV